MEKPVASDASLAIFVADKLVRDDADLLIG